MFKGYLVALCLLLAGCATATLGLPVEEIRALKLDGIEVRYTDDARIWWGNAEREYAEKAGDSAAPKSKARTAEEPTSGADDEAYRALINSPEAKQYVRSKLSGLIVERVRREIGSDLNGTRPIKIVATVHAFTIPSPVQRITLGGQPILAAVTTLVDAKTGAEIGKLDQLAAAGAGQGVIGVLVDQAFDDLETRVLDQYATNIRNWLLPAPKTSSVTPASIEKPGR